MILETERIKLLSLDYEQLVDYVKGHKGFIKTDEDEKKVWGYTVVPMSEAPIGEHLFYTIWRGYYNGEDILQMGLLRPVNENGVVEIWVHVKDEYMNRGFGSEAIYGMVNWCRRFDEIDFVGASVEPTNKASEKMLLKCGFEYGGIHKDVNIFYFRLKN